MQDIKTAANVFGAVRRARKAGASGVQIKPVQTLPIITLAPGYYNTMEGCLTYKLGRDTDNAVRAVFKSLPYETQRRLEFTPKKPGEWVERARFWQRELEPVLPPKMKHEVMMLFIGWYAHCIRSGAAYDAGKERPKHDAN